MSTRPSHRLASLVTLALLGPIGACGEDPAPGGGDTGDTALTDTALADTALADTALADTSAAQVDTSEPPPSSIASQTFAAPTPWAEPIDDYIVTGQAEVHSLAFLRGILDLRSYEGRLYVGFGDANLNLGRVFPIDFRSFHDPDDTSITNEFISDEEQLDRFRQIGDDLWMAGIDATEDAWLGNVYRRTPTTNWVKLRTVQNGVHVHDVAGFQGDIYAVGSGATPEEWGAGDIYGHLWRSDDLGESWEIAYRVHNGGAGDARLTRLLSFDTPSAPLFLFGYTSNAEWLIDSLPHGSWDGERFTPLPAAHPLARAMVLETDRVGPGRGLIRTKDFSVSPAVQRAFWFTDEGVATPIDAFTDLTVVDLDVVEATGELLALTVDGADWQPGPLGIHNVRAWVCDAEGDQWSQVFALETTMEPQSVAWWRGRIYLGTTSGQVWRSTPVE